MSAPYSIGSERWNGLSKLIEEAGEIVQVAGKIIATGGNRQHWEGSDLKVRLEEEIADLVAAVQFMTERGAIDGDHIRRRAARKLETFTRWHHESQEDETP